MAEQPDLGEFNGLPILAVKAITTRTGDGLSDALKVEPVLFNLDDECYLAFKVRKIKDQHVLVRDKTGEGIGVDHVQVFAAEGAAFVDTKVVRAAVAKVSEKVAAQKAAEETAQAAFDISGVVDDDSDEDL